MTTNESAVEPAVEATRREQSMKGPIRYILVTAGCAVVAGTFAWRMSPDGIGPVPAFVILLVFGAASAFLKIDAVAEDVDVSFTSVVLIAAIPLLGPFGAAALAFAVPFADYRRNGPPLIAVIFNALMYSLGSSCAAFAYLLLGGHNPRVGETSPMEFLLHVAVPLLAADIVLCVVNLAVLAGMMLVTGVNPRPMLLGPGLRTLPLYLGYGLTAFLFALLWEPAGLGPLAAVFIVAPLIVARWAYRQYVEQRQAHAHIIDTLAAAGRSRDRVPARAERIAELTKLLQVELQLSERDIVSLTNGAALHDIGMLAVPRSVLRQAPAELDGEDLRLIAAHSEVGYDVVRDIDFLADTALVVRHHHERFDGSGYPAGLARTAIPLAARVLAVADAYEAAVWGAGSGGEAPPRARHSEGLAQVRAKAGTAYDPEVVDALERIIGAGLPDDSVLAAADPVEVPTLSSSIRPATTEVDELVRGAVRAAGVRRSVAASTPVGRGRIASIRSRQHLPLVFMCAVALLLPFLLVLTDPDAASPSDSDPGVHWGIVAVFVCTLIAAERFRIRRRGRPEAAPMALAAGLAMALTTAMPGIPAFTMPTWTVVGAVAIAMVFDWATTRWRTGATERANLAFDSAVRLGVVFVVSVVIRDIPWLNGQPLSKLMEGWSPTGRALVMAVVVVLALMAEVPLRAWWRGRLERVRTRILLAEQFRNSLGLGAAMAATGVLVAAAEPVLGLFALPLVLIPLAITQLSVRWHEDVRFAHLQAIRALSRLPETAGLVPKGHAESVAMFSVAVARELGMPARDVEDLEHAALLHDVGQVALRRPIPSGATVLAAPGDQERIAQLGAEIAAQTGELATVSNILEGQAVPYHRVVKGLMRLSPASRIIKVVNAYDDFARTAVGSANARRGHALERLYLGLRHEFDPAVVGALERVLRERSQGSHSLGTAPLTRPQLAALPERSVPRQ